jgi:D-glycero-alpha-D-manno-heptose 1-phosphate guanylyltransferase
MECIVLAGGLGTRLKSAIGEIPKCMAPMNNKPFLHYLFEYLRLQNCSRVILSLGHKHQVILDWLSQQSLPFVVDHVIEHEPLGTGGGIRLALDRATSDNVIVLNGDTMFNIVLSDLLAFHSSHSAETTLALKHMHQFDRYGSVKTNAVGTITAFEEKQYKEEGLINGGVYFINRRAFLNRHLPAKFSFEKDYLETFVDDHRFYGQVHDAYFIDIGIPADYLQAQEDFKQIFS